MSAQKGRDTFHLIQVKRKCEWKCHCAEGGVSPFSCPFPADQPAGDYRRVIKSSAFASAQSNTSPHASESHTNSRNPGKCSSPASCEYEKSKLHGQDLHHRYDSGSGNKLVEQSNKTRCSQPELYFNQSVETKVQITD